MTDKLLFHKWARDNNLETACKKRVRIFNYEQGHVRYQLGHYPCSVPYEPNEDDWRLLDIYAKNGLRIVHVWCWSEWLNLFGKGAHLPLNEKGLRRFIDECHRRDLKAIPYISPGFLDPQDPFYKDEWSSYTPPLHETYFNLQRMCPGSLGWRKHFFGAVDRLLGDYGFDGLYWDTGFSIGCSNPNADNHIHFEEHSPYKGTEAGIDHAKEARYIESMSCQGTWDLWNEFLCEIYAKVKKKDGIVVAHIGTDRESPFKDKPWDYLLLGECVGDIKKSTEKTRWYDPYVLRFNDWSRLVTDWPNRDFTPCFEQVAEIEHYGMAAAIPYMQFEWLEDGNLGSDEDLTAIPGAPWKKEFDMWTEWYRAQKKASLPDVLFASFIAGRDRYFEYLKVYRKMTAANTVAHLEIKDFKGGPFPASDEDIKVSVFINDSLWVAISNLSNEVKYVGILPLSGNGNLIKLKLNKKRLTVLNYETINNLPKVIVFAE
jgi:hypothetical protein